MLESGTEHSQIQVQDASKLMLSTKANVDYSHFCIHKDANLLSIYPVETPPCSSPFILDFSFSWNEK